jgi:hypothetical protein
VALLGAARRADASRGRIADTEELGVRHSLSNAGQPTARLRRGCGGPQLGPDRRAFWSVTTRGRSGRRTERRRAARDEKGLPWRGHRSVELV